MILQKIQIIYRFYYFKLTKIPLLALCMSFLTTSLYHFTALAQTYSCLKWVSVCVTHTLDTLRTWHVSLSAIDRLKSTHTHTQEVVGVCWRGSAVALSREWFHSCIRKPMLLTHNLTAHLDFRSLKTCSALFTRIISPGSCPKVELCEHWNGCSLLI